MPLTRTGSITRRLCTDGGLRHSLWMGMEPTGSRNACTARSNTAGDRTIFLSSEGGQVRQVKHGTLPLGLPEDTTPLAVSHMIKSPHGAFGRLSKMRGHLTPSVPTAARSTC
ncbi:unnamed protein product, partial [Ectocarpus sp. 12 AP-2014]